MKCEDFELLLPEFLEGELPELQTRRVHEHLQQCAACARSAETQRRIDAAFRHAPAPQPGPRLDTLFHTWFEAERAAAFPERAAAPARHSWLRQVMNHGTMAAAAACVLFAAGVLFGPRVWHEANTTTSAETADQIAELRLQLAAVQATMAWTLVAQQPASDRLQAVRALDAAPEQARTLHQLLSVLAYDTSPAVRQTAVEALYRYVEEPAVREAIAIALLREPSPVVQLAIVDLLASTRDPAAASALEVFTRSGSSGNVVREAASVALTRM